MDTIYWHMNETQGGANLYPGVNLLPGANCAHEHGFRSKTSKNFRNPSTCVPLTLG